MQFILNVTINKGKNKIPRRKKGFEHLLLKKLKPCDVILVRFRGKEDFMGSVISHFTSSPYSHVEIHLFDGFVVSASKTGVIYDDILKHGTIDIFRYSKLTREEKLIITAKAHQSVFKPYHYANTILFPFITDEMAAKWSKNNAYMCSENVAWCYKEAGLDLVPDLLEAAEAPMDLANSKMLKYYGTYNARTGSIVSMEAAGKVIAPKQYNKRAIIVSNILKILSNRDERYEKLDKK